MLFVWLDRSLQCIVVVVILYESEMFLLACLLSSLMFFDECILVEVHLAGRHLTSSLSEMGSCLRLSLVRNLLSMGCLRDRLFDLTEGPLGHRVGWFDVEEVPQQYGVSILGSPSRWGPHLQVGTLAG